MTTTTTAPARRSRGQKAAQRDKLLERFPLQSYADENGKLPSKGRRVALFLEYWARVMPYNFAAYHEVVKAIEGYKRTPRAEGKEASAIRNGMTSAKKILLASFGRSLITSRGVGVRATVDDFDLMRNAAIPAAQTAQRSLHRVVELDKHVNVSAIPDTPETKALKKHYVSNTRQFLKQIGSEGSLAKLLPPKADE